MPFSLSSTATWRRCHDAGTLKANQRLMRNAIEWATRTRFSHIDGFELVRMDLREDLVTSNALSFGDFRNTEILRMAALPGWQWVGMIPV